MATRYSPRTGLPTTYQAGPYSAEHFYVQWGGKLPGNEQWSCGVRMQNKGGGGLADRAALLPAVSAAILAMHTDPNVQIAGPAKLSFVKANMISTSGDYVEDVSGEIVHADVAGGGGAAQKYPNQVALAVSLTTGFTRGPAHRGRFYLPLPNETLDTVGVITAGALGPTETALEAWLTAMNAAHAYWEVAVFSRKAGAPAKRKVTGIEIGRVLDTQRRRRRSLLEQYVGV